MANVVGSDGKCAPFDEAVKRDLEVRRLFREQDARIKAEEEAEREATRARIKARMEAEEAEEDDVG